MDNLKDFKNEALVVTNASDGNTPHIVQGIEPDGSLSHQTAGTGKALRDFSAHRPQRVRDRNVLLQHEPPV